MNEPRKTQNRDDRTDQALVIVSLVTVVIGVVLFSIFSLLTQGCGPNVGGF